MMFRLKNLSIFVFVCFVAALAYRSSVGREIKLEPAPALAGIVAQSMYAGGAKTTLPTAGVDFNLKDVKYFDNKAWVVAGVAPVHNNFDPGTVILEQKGGTYQVVAAPGGRFPSSYLVSLPKDVSAYLQAEGLIDEPGQ